MYGAAKDGLNRGSRAKPGVSGWGEQLTREARAAAPAATRKLDPRYTATGAPIPSKFPGGAGATAGGGNAGSFRYVDPNAAPVPRVTPRSEVQSQALGTAIQQAQGPSFWESNTALKEAADSGPRAGTAGYSGRADIQAWMEAMNKTPAGQKMVQQFLEKERKAGRIAEPMNSDQAILRAQGSGALDGFKGGTTDDALLFAQGRGGLDGAAPAAMTSDQAILRAQAAGALDDFKGGTTDDAILQAQMRNAWGDTAADGASNAEFQPMAALNYQDNGSAVLSGFEPGQRFTNPEINRGLAQQPAVDAQATFTNMANFAGTDPLLQKHLTRAFWS